MRRFLIASLGLLSLISLADLGFASPHAVGDHSKSDIMERCNRLGGKFYESESGSYMCRYKSGNLIECNVGRHCMFVSPFTADKSKAGAGTTAGGLGNAQFPGGTTGPGASTGGTAPAAGTLNGSANGPVVRDHRPGGNALDAPPRAAPTAGKVNTPARGTAPARATNAAPRAAVAGGAAASQKNRSLQ